VCYVLKGLQDAADKNPKSAKILILKLYKQPNICGVHYPFLEELLSCDLSRRGSSEAIISWTNGRRGRVGGQAGDHMHVGLDSC